MHLHIDLTTIFFLLSFLSLAEDNKTDDTLKCVSDVFQSDIIVFILKMAKKNASISYVHYHSFFIFYNNIFGSSCYL